MAAACQSAVLKYMEQENRPYSYIDVQQNLHGKYTKPAVQKALEELAEQGKLMVKEQGKSKIYCAIQVDNGSGADAAAQQLELDSSILSVSQNLKNVEQQLREAVAKLKDLESSLTTEAAEAEAVAMEGRLQRLRTKLADLTDNYTVECPQDREKTEREHKQTRSAYISRKRQFTNVFNDILENSDKSKKALMEEIGVETDEDAGLKL